MISFTCSPFFALTTLGLKSYFMAVILTPAAPGEASCAIPPNAVKAASANVLVTLKTILTSCTPYENIERLWGSRSWLRRTFSGPALAGLKAGCRHDCLPHTTELTVSQLSKHARRDTRTDRRPLR